MSVVDRNNPLIIEVGKFLSLDEYLSSLSKSSKKDLKSVLHKNRGISYHRIPYDRDLVEIFMGMWESQPLSNGKFPRWGEWDSDSITRHSGETLLFASLINEEIASIHFVFKWGNYVYCNSPLYNKERFSNIDLGKFMWVNLIEYSIMDGSIEYLDLVAPDWGSRTWPEIISERAHPNMGGDFGYKWKFIPQHIKETPTIQPRYQIGSCKLCGNKWISQGSDIIKCKCKPASKSKLLIVAHPDDESIFFGNWLSKNSSSATVICVTGGMNPVRKSEFVKAMTHLGIDSYEIWDYEYSLEPLKGKESIEEDLQRIKLSGNWDSVVTHGRYGEYGHIQHIEVHELVTRIFSDYRIMVFEISKKPISKEELLRKIELNRIYASEYKTGFSEILVSLATGSDWYKHAIGFNMVEYESVVDMGRTKTSLRIVSISPDRFSKFPFYKNFETISRLLSERGHSVNIRKVDEDLKEYDCCLVFTLDDADYMSRRGEKYFLVSLDGSLEDGDESKDKISRVSRIVGKSVRSLFMSKRARNLIGNPTNAVFINPQVSWYRKIRRIESNILMGIVSSNLNFGSISPFSNIRIEEDGRRLSFLYSGETIGRRTLYLTRNDGYTLMNYTLDLTKGVNYWIEFNPEWNLGELRISVLDHRYPYEQDL